MEVEFHEGFKGEWNKDTEGIFLSSDKDTEGRVLNEKPVINKVEEIYSIGTGIIDELETKRKGVDRPQLL